MAGTIAGTADKQRGHSQIMLLEDFKLEVNPQSLMKRLKFSQIKLETPTIQEPDSASVEALT